MGPMEFEPQAALPVITAMLNSGGGESRRT
jgi:hypothetical protein